MSWRIVCYRKENSLKIFEKSHHCKLINAQTEVETLSEHIKAVQAELKKAQSDRDNCRNAANSPTAN